MRYELFAFAAVAALTGTALAQPADNTAPVSIVVQNPDPAAARQFVHNVALAPESPGTLARWGRSICPGVAGARPEVAQAVIDRVARRANAVGVTTGAPGCTPNLMIVLTADSDRFAQGVGTQRRAALLSPPGIESSTLGEAAFTTFISTPRPVRWWHVAQTTMADGEVLADTRSSSSTGAGAAASSVSSTSNAMSPSAGEGVGSVNATRADGTRLRGSTRQDLNYVLVIVDTQRSGGVTVNALADYVAFVSLAQVNPNVNTASYPSILNLFNEQRRGPRPAEMTAWDLAYLDGLYHASRSPRNGAQQEDEIARRMTSSHS
jgi:hypothetical protein